MRIKGMYIHVKWFGWFSFFGAFFMLFVSAPSLAQQRTITGTVTSSEDNQPLPGVNILFHGTTNGTITNLEGKYVIEIPVGDVTLQFSFVGYNTELITVGSSIVIDVVMLPNLLALDEVVITSLGITKEKKRITYSAQNITTDNLAQARELNVANSMQGKVAGMDVIKSSSGVGSATRILLRGNRSIAANNQPLYIVDGAPIQNFAWESPDSENGGVQRQDGISDINPDDITSVTVLKGPNATALYGSRASNGAIVITTRKGAVIKGIGVELNTNWSMDKALILTKFQHEYGQGNGGVYVKNYELAWGPKMTGQMVDHWSPNPNWIADGNPAQYAYSPHNNFEDFFQTGYNIANTLTLTCGTEKVRTLFSYTNTRSEGIVETNKLRRNNFNLRIDGNLSKRISFDTKLTYVRQVVINRLATGDSYSNPMRALYRQPSNISLDQVRNFEFFDNAGIRLQHYWNPGTNGGENIYWMLYRGALNEEIRDRVLGMASMRYAFTDHLSLQVRTSFDKLTDAWDYREYHNTFTIADFGDMQLSNRHAMEFNGDALLNYNNSWADDLITLEASVGGNMRINGSTTLTTQTNTMLKPNLFVITNTSRISASQGGSEKQVNSLLGYATVGFKNSLFLHVTGRNDWSSTLPKDSWSYFYPSVGLNWIITEMLETNPGILTFAKVRASYAGVGNDTDPYRLSRTYSFGAGGQLGYAWRGGTLPNVDLKPENTKSTELGFDVRFFNNRLGLDFTWYKSNTFNQLLSVPLPRASGYTARFINAGNVQNKGIEFTVNATPVRSGDFAWDIIFNYAKNKNLVIKVSDAVEEYIIRDRSWMTTIKVTEGEPYGQIYTRGFERNDDERILINSLGLPRITNGQIKRMGNANPDWIGGLSNMFRYKRINLYILIDTRMGGDVFSFTEAILTKGGFSKSTLEGRNGMVVDGVLDSDGSENIIETTAEAYWIKFGGRNTPVGELFRYDASYVRLRELVLRYKFELNSKVIQGIDIALYGRNLAFLYNASKIVDPNMSVGIGNIQGLEGLSIPSSRNYGINTRFKF